MTLRLARPARTLLLVLSSVTFAGVAASSGSSGASTPRAGVAADCGGGRHALVQPRVLGSVQAEGDEQEAQAAVDRSLDDMLDAIRRSPLPAPRASRAYAATTLAIHEAHALLPNSARAIEWAGSGILHAPGLYSRGTNRTASWPREPRTPAESVEALTGLLAAVRIASVFHTDGAADAATSTRRYSLDRDRAARAGRWVPTPPELLPPLEPGWGDVETRLIGGVQSIRMLEAPAWDSPAFANSRERFRKVQERLTDADIDLGYEHADGPGTATPAGTWIERAREAAADAELSVADQVAMHALVAGILHDAFVVSWWMKYDQQVARPVQWMRLEHDESWRPVVATPPFPSYPSGHSTISAAAAEMIGRLVPARSEAEREFAGLVSRSRIVGGIHWDIDAVDGERQGAMITGAAWDRLTACGSSSS